MSPLKNRLYHFKPGVGLGTAVCLFLLIIFYLLVTLPYLADFPLVESAQMGIAAPAYKLATQGVYGNDLYRGLYGVESRNYEYMPLYPLFVAVAFKLWGLGVWQGRLVSLFCGLLVVVLTFRLGKTAVNTPVGLLAAAVLCLLPLTIIGPANDLYPGAIPLLDFARVLRYDVMTPVWVLAACLAFLWAGRTHRAAGYVATGLFTGLATLSHLYGGFILAVFAILLLWQKGWPGRQPLLLILAGWFICLLPWLVYVGQDLPAYRGQMLRHESRFDLLKPAFYLDNLQREPSRYLNIAGPFQLAAGWPRPGFWLVIAAVLAAYVKLWDRIRQRPSLPDRFLFITLPTLAFLLAALVSFKRYAYVVLLLPFLAIVVALGITVIWQWGQRRGRLWTGLLLLWLLAAAAEGVMSIASYRQMAQATTPYRELTAVLRQNTPAGSRILMIPGFWLGLAENDVYSLDLAYNLSNASFVREAARPLPQVMAQLAPAYIIVPQHLLQSYLTPETLPGDHVAKFWQTLETFIHEKCPETITQIQSQTYGVVSVYRCHWPVNIETEP